MRTRVLMLVVAVVALATVSVEATAQSPAPTAAMPSAGTSEPLREVTVTAKRLNLAPAVRKFVNQIARLENREGLARWDTPVCPTVIGLPREEVEFILGRIAEIARAAGVPMAGESCNPNLFVVVTADPKGLLEGWNDHNNTRLGIFNGATWRHDLNGAPQSVVEPFINTPRAARVWYYTGASDTWNALRAAAGPNLEPSVLSMNIVYGFFRVFVIADQTRLNGPTIGQFADYVSMVGLAQIKPDTHLGDTPTILKLFDEVPQPAPAGMTDWDRSFLKSLYASDQRLKTQRDLMAKDMVRHVTH
jgi:hypothetical protein